MRYVAVISFREAKRAFWWSRGLGEGRVGRGGGGGCASGISVMIGSSLSIGAEAGRLSRGEGMGVKSRL